MVSQKNFISMVFYLKKDIIQDLSILSELNCSLIFFILQKLDKVLSEFKNFYRQKNFNCREMTKIYEEFIRSDVEKIDISSNFKGEFTVVISERYKEKKSSQILSESDKSNIKKMINKFSVKEITTLICLDGNISKKEIYNYCLKLKNEK